MGNNLERTRPSWRHRSEMSLCYGSLQDRLALAILYPGSGTLNLCSQLTLLWTDL